MQTHEDHPSRCISPGTICSIVAGHPNLTEEDLHNILNSLITTIQTCQGHWDTKRKDYEECLEHLQEHLNEYTNNDVPPDSYIINGRCVRTGIPILADISIQAKFVKQLPDGQVACLTDHEDMADMPYIVDIYAEPHITNWGDNSRYPSGWTMPYMPTQISSKMLPTSSPRSMTGDCHVTSNATMTWTARSGKLSRRLRSWSITSSPTKDSSITAAITLTAQTSSTAPPTLSC